MTHRHFTRYDKNRHTEFLPHWQLKMKVMMVMVVIFCFHVVFRAVID